MGVRKESQINKLGTNMGTFKLMLRTVHIIFLWGNDGLCNLRI